jgi:uncharacterized membrane-anchored protein YitT (DUF2179 family)
MNKETNNREAVSTGEAFTASERRRVFWLVLVLIPLSWTSIKKVAAPTAALIAVGLFSSASLTSFVTMNLYIRDTVWPVAAYLGILSSIGLAACYFWVWLPYCGKDFAKG